MSRKSDLSLSLLSGTARAASVTMSIRPRSRHARSATVTDAGSAARDPSIFCSPTLTESVASLAAPRERRSVALPDANYARSFARV